MEVHTKAVISQWLKISATVETHHQKAKPNQEQNQHHNRHSGFVPVGALMISWLGKQKPFVQSTPQAVHELQVA